jgi:hypothetical protein
VGRRLAGNPRRAGIQVQIFPSTCPLVDEFMNAHKATTQTDGASALR